MWFKIWLLKKSQYHHVFLIIIKWIYGHGFRVSSNYLCDLFGEGGYGPTKIYVYKPIAMLDSKIDSILEVWINTIAEFELKI
jgi:hypothetical protein